MSHPSREHSNPIDRLGPQLDDSNSPFPEVLFGTLCGRLAVLGQPTYAHSGEEVPVKTQWTGRHPVSGKIVVAELRGVVDWRTGSVRLSGAFSEEQWLVRQDPVDSPAPPAAQVRLTRRERQVAELLARGDSNADIAIQLGISPHTARRHTESVLLKLGVRARAQVGPRLARSKDQDK